MQTAQQFIGFMNRVWTDKCEPAPDGGTIIRVSEDYDEWHDAIKSAQRLGAVKRWPMRKDDEYGYVFEFPNGSRCWIATHGGAVRPVRRHDRVGE